LVLVFWALCWAGPWGPALSADETESADGTVQIGASLSLTGVYAEPAGMMEKAYRLWERQTNEKGGLLGHPVELTIKDDRSDPERAARIYRDYIENQQVDLVLSPYGTPITLEVSEITERHGYVLIAAAAAGDEVWERGYSHVFGMYAPADRFFIGFLDLCARNGIDGVSIVYEKNPFNRDAANGAHIWAGRMGLSPIRLFGIDPGAGEIEEVWRRVEEAGNSALVVSSYPPVGYELIDQLKSSDYRPDATAMTITPIDPSFYRRAGNVAEGIFAPSQWEPNERIPFPGTEEFISSYKAFTGEEPTYHSASAFSACRILDEAIAATGGFDHEKLSDYIAGLNTVTIIGRFKVDHTGRQVGHNPMLIQWQDGEKVIVHPRSVRTAEPRF
jgi:branched-chain amino acid transport system substrate-binding protein